MANDKKPSASKFKQQTLPAWRPILTPKTVLPVFVLIGIIFVAIGGVLLAANSKVQEIDIEYTDWEQVLTTDQGTKCSELLGDHETNYTSNLQDHKGIRCQVEQSLDVSGFAGEETYLYYGLDNYFQNHRRYVDSRSDPQLRMKEEGEATEECDPIEKNENSTRYFAPCGLIANSLFNDTIEIFECLDDDCDTSSDASTTKLDLSGENIAWKSDRDVKFQNYEKDGGWSKDGANTTATNGDLCKMRAFGEERSIPPPNWPVKACELGKNYTTLGRAECAPFDPNNAADCDYNPHAPEYGSNGNGYEHEDLIVWMRTAALPQFRKLYRKVGTTLKDGKYKVKIGYNYPVASFKGKKRFLLSTTSAIGGKNSFLGIAYVTVGSLSLISAAIFFGMMMMDKNGRAEPDLNNMKWD